MTPTDWLLESDPAISWQAMDALTSAAAAHVAAERAKVAQTGWGATLLGRQDADGVWRTPGYELASGRWYGSAGWTTLAVLQLLREFGPDPASRDVAAAIARLAGSAAFLTSMPPFMAWAGLPFFAGETEPCINGRVVAVGAYFGQDVQSVVDRLLGEQMTDGGWNCEQENGSVRGSFGSTINVLEGLLEFEHATGGTPATHEARQRGEEYLLVRGLMRRLSTGEPIKSDFTRFALPNGWHYDILRGLDYLRAAEAPRDARLDEALALVAAKRGADGRWLLEQKHSDEQVFDMGEAEGQPSRWITLRAMRVLAYFKAA